MRPTELFFHMVKTLYYPVQGGTNYSNDSYGGPLSFNEL